MLPINGTQIRYLPTNIMLECKSSHPTSTTGTPTFNMFIKKGEVFESQCIKSPQKVRLPEAIRIYNGLPVCQEVNP